MGKDKQVVRYVGDGKFLHGVPARDMSMDEWNALDENLRVLALKLGLYQLPKGEKPKGDKEGEA